MRRMLEKNVDEVEKKSIIKRLGEDIINKKGEIGRNVKGLIGDVRRIEKKRISKREKYLGKMGFERKSRKGKDSKRRKKVRKEVNEIE